MIGRRWLLWAVLGVLVVVVGVVVAFKPAWDERAPDLEWKPGLVRLEGSCCARMSPGSWQYSVSNAEYAEIMLSVEFTSLETDRTSVRAGSADFSYRIYREDAGRPASEGISAVYAATGLSVGDTVTQGPVTIEVVAVYDFFFNRNNAVDLRVTFDDSRLDEAP